MAQAGATQVIPLKPSTKCDEVAGGMELEEKQFAGLKGLEVRRGRTPEVCFRQIGDGSKRVEPFSVRDCDYEPYAQILAPFVDLATLRFSRNHEAS